MHSAEDPFDEFLQFLPVDSSVFVLVVLGYHGIDFLEIGFGPVDSPVDIVQKLGHLLPVQVAVLVSVMFLENAFHNLVDFVFRDIHVIVYIYPNSKRFKAE